MHSRTKYSETFVSIVDIIAAFFTDTFVNELYGKAKQLADSGQLSITEQYKRVITQYAHGVSNNPEKCKLVVMNLRNYYSQVTKYSSITYVDFENTILEQFIPPDYYGDFRSKEKTAAMSSIVVEAVQSALTYIVKPGVLKYIIDCRLDGQKYILSIQDHIAQSVTVRRDEFFVDFARKINEKSQKVSVEILRDLREELKNQVERRCKAEAEREKAMGIIFQLVEKIKNMNVGVDSSRGQTDSEPGRAPSGDHSGRFSACRQSPVRPQVQPSAQPVTQPAAQPVASAYKRPEWLPGDTSRLDNIDAVQAGREPVQPVDDASSGAPNSVSSVSADDTDCYDINFSLDEFVD